MRRWNSRLFFIPFQLFKVIYRFISRWLFIALCFFMIFISIDHFLRHFKVLLTKLPNFLIFQRVRRRLFIQFLSQNSCLFTWIFTHFFLHLFILLFLHFVLLLPDLLHKMPTLFFTFFQLHYQICRRLQKNIKILLAIYTYLIFVCIQVYQKVVLLFVQTQAIKHLSCYLRIPQPCNLKQLVFDLPLLHIFDLHHLLLLLDLTLNPKNFFPVSLLQVVKMWHIVRTK